MLQNICKIGNLPNDTAERTQRLIGFYDSLDFISSSWRTMFLLQLGRSYENIHTNIVLNQAQFDVLNIVSSTEYNQDISNISVGNNVIEKFGGYTKQTNSILDYEVFWSCCTTLCHMIESYRYLMNYFSRLFGRIC